MKIYNIQLKSKLTSILIAVLANIQIMQAQEIFRAEGPSAAVQLRTNGLYDLALCPNIGLEIQTDLGIAWQLDYTGAWWNNDTKNKYFSSYAFQTELRYYLSSQKMSFPYTGHHVGLYGQMATYDFEFGGTGYQCRDLDGSFGIGLSYGFSMPVSRHFSLDFTLGLGYFTSKYWVYEPSADWYALTSSKRLTWFGPTKLEATLVWNINAKNNK